MHDERHPDAQLPDAQLRWPAGRVRPYVNHLEISLTMSEVELCLGQASGAPGDVRHRNWFLTSPVHLAGFASKIGTVLDAYEGRYGRIPQSKIDEEGGD